MYRAGDQEVQGKDAYASGQEASPEDGGAVEGGALLNGEQQAPYRCCKSSCYACTAPQALLSCMTITVGRHREVARSAGGREGEGWRSIARGRLLLHWERGERGGDAVETL